MQPQAALAWAQQCVLESTRNRFEPAFTENLSREAGNMCRFLLSPWVLYMVSRMEPKVCANADGFDMALLHAQMRKALDACPCLGLKSGFGPLHTRSADCVPHTCTASGFCRPSQTALTVGCGGKSFMDVRSGLTSIRWLTSAFSCVTSISWWMA